MNKPFLENNSSQSLLEEIIHLAFEKKAQNLILLDLRGLSYLSDYFIVCNGTSEPQVKAIVDNIRKKKGKSPFINKKNPDVGLHIFIIDKIVKIYLNTTGIPLHKRGYRSKIHKAALNESLALSLIHI